MLIGLDGTTLCDADGGVGAGVEHYTWEMISALIQQKTPHTFVLHVPSQLTEQRLQQLLEGAQSAVLVQRSLLPRIPFLSQHVFLPLVFLMRGVSVYFSPSGQIPLGWFGRSVATVHDVSIFEHPEWFASLGNQYFSKRIVVPRTILRADRLLAVSKTTAERLVALFPTVAGKTALVYEGVRVPEFVLVEKTSKRFPFDRDVILYLGTIEPRKNIPFAIEAFDAFLRQHPESASTTRLILAGKRGWDTEDVVTMAEEMNRVWADLAPSGVIQFLGTVTEEEKWTLLSRASVFVFPSLEEGFGLPILEAMAVGTPVICSNAEALLEVGGDAVIPVENVESFALALAQCLLLPEGGEMLRKDGLERVKQFTWEQSAQAALHVMESLPIKKRPE